MKDYKKEILNDGYFIIENFFDAVKFNIVKILNENIQKVSIANGDLLTRYFHLLGVDTLFSSLLLDTTVLDIAHNILGECINLSDYQIVQVHPGAPSINPHIDYPFVLMDKSFYDPIALLQTLWVLDDFTETNGATRILPGSHKLCSWPDKEIFEKESKKLILKKGSLVVFHGNLWHDTSPNTSNSDRSSLIISFCPPWINRLSKIEKNLDINNDLPVEIKELLGKLNTENLKNNLKLKQNQTYNYIKK